MENIVLNLLVFEKKIKEGYSQKEVIEIGIDLGFKQFEVRREYFKKLEEEVLDIKKLVETFNIELFYSVPDEVFVSGSINPKLKNYLEESKQMGAKHVKWNIGDFDHYRGDLSELEPLTKEGIEINIENDQTQTSGKIKAIETFMKAVTNEGLNIGYVYDLGNWPFVGEDEEVAAKKLAEYVRYIHVKDAKKAGLKPIVVPLDQGDIDWRNILKLLPKTVPVAIEYPTTSEEDLIVARQLLEGED